MAVSGRGYQQFFAELKRRHVFKVAAIYGAVAFGILQVAEPLGTALGLSDSFLSLVVGLLLLGFPVALVLAWAFEVTPEGVQKAEPAAPGEIENIMAQPASKRWPAGLLALAGAALLFGGWWMGRQAAPVIGASDETQASIAVLPFADMSPDKDQEHFSDGISEELLNLLTKIGPELKVAARTSSFSFKGQNVGILAIADSLNVAHVLEGSVRTADDVVRITAQLIRAHDGFHVWSETWERPYRDIFAIQDEIAAAVVAQLKVTLLGEVPTVEETDPEAYGLYLQAQQVGRQFTPESLERSNALYQLALEIDPDYASAWAGLAGNYNTQGAYGFRPDGGFQLAREAADRALAIDPDNAAAYAILSTIARVHDNDLSASARHMERALALAPTDLDVMRDAAAVLMDLGRLDESIPPLEYVAARDPVNPAALMRLSLAYMWAGRPNEALPLLRRAESLVPGRTASRAAIGGALLAMGQPEAALAEIRQEPHEQYRLLGLTRVHHVLGQASESDAALTALIEEHGDWAYNIAYVFAFRGEPDRAFEWLDKAVEYNDTGLSQLPINNLFANIHDDPRWLPFLESIGKSPEQLAAIEFDVRLPGSAP